MNDSHGPLPWNFINSKQTKLFKELIAHQFFIFYFERNFELFEFHDLKPSNVLGIVTAVMRFQRLDEWPDNKRTGIKRFLINLLFFIVGLRQISITRNNKLLRLVLCLLFQFFLWMTNIPKKHSPLPSLIDWQLLVHEENWSRFSSWLIF